MPQALVKRGNISVCLIYTLVSVSFLTSPLSNFIFILWGPSCQKMPTIQVRFTLLIIFIIYSIIYKKGLLLIR